MSYLANLIEMLQWLVSANEDAEQAFNVPDLFILLGLAMIFCGLTGALVSLRQKRRRAHKTRQFSSAEVAITRLRNA